MRLLAAPLLAVLVAAGCVPEEPEVNVAVRPPEAVQQFPEPDYAEHTEIGLIENGQRLRVGDRREIAEELFPPPPRSSRIRELPTGFPPVYVARGWEKNDDSEGFGALLFQDRVAAAMQQFQRVDAEFIRELVTRYEAVFGPSAFIYGEAVRYWFWESGPHTLMICAYEPTATDRRLTIAMGDSDVLDRIGVSVRRAQADRNALDQLRRAREGEPAVHKG